MLLIELINIDYFITNLILGFPHPFILNSIFDFFSISGWWLLVWGLIFLYLFFIEEKKHREFVILFFLSLLISSFFTNIILKNIFRRARPYHQISNFQFKISKSNTTNFNQFQPVLNNYPSDFSFPSGHATLSFSAATVLSYFEKRRKIFFYSIAVLIAFSRIYLGYHFFFDVVIGSLIGWVLSKMILKINKIP